MKNKFILFAIFIFAIIKTSLSQISIEPIAHYKLDGNADDAINNNNGIIYGNITATPDRNGNPCGAMEFDGASYIEIPNSSELQNITSDFTITGWIYFSSKCNDNLFWATILCKGDGTAETDNNPQFRLQFTKVTFSIKSNMVDNKGCVPWDMSSVFSHDRWYFFATTYSGSVVKMYLDGNEIFSYTLNQSLSPNTSPLHIGRDVPGADEFFCGKLDDIRIYNKSLSSNDIMKIYNYVTPTNCKGDSCNFPEELAGNSINYDFREYHTKKKKIMVFASDKIGHDDTILININGKWQTNPIELSDNRQYIYEGFLNQKCNYILFKSIHDIAVFDIQIDRETYGTKECSETQFYGIKIIYDK